VGLFLDKPWAERALRVAAGALLVVGLALVAGLALTASYLIGIYGPVGRGGAIILVLVAALVLPYLVVLPLAELLWLGNRVRERQGDARPARDRASAAPGHARVRDADESSSSQLARAEEIA
jgi:hypothetical protein